MSNNYNQYEEYYTRNACSIVTLLNILKYRYGIFVVPSFIMKIAIALEVLWVFSPSGWAVFNTIYKIFVWDLNRKLWLNFEVILAQIDTFPANNFDTYWIWIKWYSSYKWDKIKKKWIITDADMDWLATFTWWVWHNAGIDMSAWGYFIDTDWSKNTQIRLHTLKYWEKLWIFRNNIRTVSPVDEITKAVCKLTIRMFQAEKKWKLNEYLYINMEEPYMKKACELYFYGKDKKTFA